ncbi:MAG: M20 family metallopeptidase [Clostridiales bacterium]|nr:M20 family metallopeptidase [Clostridiales bacterium]
MDKYSILRDLIQFNTAFDAQNQAIMEYIDKYLTDKGFRTNYCIDDDTQKKCLVATAGVNPVLGFVCHTDTSPLGANWSDYDAMDLTLDGDKLIGLGISEMKGGMAAVLSAVGNFDWKLPKKGLKLFFTFDEENNFTGIKTIVAKEKEIPQNIIIPTPTSLYPVVATKGLLKLCVMISGKPAHSSNPTKGSNAIEHAVSFLGEVYSFNNRLKEDKNNAFELPYTTFNLGKIQGGSSLNSVPGECSTYLEYRTIRPDHNRQIIEKINDLASKYNGFVTVIDDVPPMSTFAENFISRLEELTGNKRSSIAVVSDGNYLGENAVVLLGPGPITSGEKNEFISKFSYETLIELYTKLLKETCF